MKDAQITQSAGAIRPTSAGRFHRPSMQVVEFCNIEFWRLTVAFDAGLSIEHVVSDPEYLFEIDFSGYNECAMLVGMNEVARAHVHATYLNRATNLHEPDICMPDSGSSCKQTESHR